MTTVLELRKLSLDARRENSNERQERYTKARDEAFEILTDGVMERIKVAATEGKFRYPIYRWTNQPKAHVAVEAGESVVDDGEATGVPEATQLTFGNDEGGVNGLHIMALVQPTGIKYEDTLMAKLREYFNSQVPSAEGNDEQTDKRNQLRVYFQRHQKNPRLCAIFVSWDRHQNTQLPRRPFVPIRPYIAHPGTSPSKTPEHPRSEEASPQRQSFGGLRTPMRGSAPFRGSPSFRGAPRGRGRMTAPVNHQ